MTDKHGDVMYRAHYGPPEGRAAARAELRRLDEQRRAETEATAERESEERRARLYFPAEDVPEPPRESVKERGDDLYEHLYVENRGRYH